MNLPKVVSKRSKRVGRGYGSGKGGHTTGRGEKGQKARGKNFILFEGYKVKKSLFKRLPLSRGKGKFKGRPKPVVIKLDLLNLFPVDAEIDLDLLIKEKIVDKDDARAFGVKILGGGKLEKKLTIAVPTSKSAAREIEKAGGRIL